MPINRAAWQDKANQPLTIRSTPYPTSLTPTQLLVKPQAWAINPCDYMLQDSALPFVTYPLVLGEDIAGTIIEAGHEASKRFKVNDRVLAFAQGAIRGSAESGFQEYVLVDATAACPIPEWMESAEAVVFPLCVTTAAHALFNRDLMGLQALGSDPSSNASSNGGGKFVLVWGGSSAVGLNAIQLARAAGVEVLTTASVQNFEYVKSLGASKVFDYTSADVISQITAEMDGRVESCVGIFQAAGSGGAVESCLEIARRVNGDIFVATSSAVQESVIPEGVRAKMVFGVDHVDIRSIWEHFLPGALARREYAIAPAPMVLEKKGLEGIQDGFEVLRKGVSVKKVVVVAE